MLAEKPWGDGVLTAKVRLVPEKTGRGAQKSQDQTGKPANLAKSDRRRPAARLAGSAGRVYGSPQLSGCFQFGLQYFLFGRSDG